MADYNTAVIALGALLVGGALVSGLAHRSFLSLTALFVLAGFLLGRDGFDVLGFTPRSGFVDELGVTALIVILFRDGLEVDAEMLQRQWRLPLRKLVLAMPLTAAIVALVAHVLTDLSWNESFLLGALLSPTDPILSSSVVTNPRVPRLIRHSLNLESGMNDGLALPAVLAFLAALKPSGGGFDWLTFMGQDIGLGLLYGVGCGLVASLLMPRRTGSLERESIPPHQKSLYSLGVAFATYGLTVTSPHGNGFIAVFVCAIVLGIRRPDLGRTFERRAEELIEIVKLGIFVVFGALLTIDGLFGDGWAAVGIVAATLLLARPVALWVSLAGAGLDRGTKAFMAWFGPKGVATMTFSLIVLAAGIHSGERVFNIAALCVFVSIVAHGLTDHAGSEWIGRRADRQEVAVAVAE